MTKLIPMIALVLTVLVSSASADQGRSKQPNIILIMPDDVGVGNVSILGADTPYPASVHETNTIHLNELALRGITFDQGYSAGNMCWPSRGALLTGSYPQRWNSRVQVPKSVPRLPKTLQELGYHTGIVGKWHNGAEKGNFPPTDWGFDEHFVTYTSHDYYETKAGPGLQWESMEQWRAVQKNTDTRPFAHRYAPLLDSRLSDDENEQFVTKFGYLTSAFNRRAVEFIEDNKDRPFFLYLPHSARHVPTQRPPERYMRRFKESGMEHVSTAMIDVVDEGIGQIQEKLEELDLLDDTIIIFIGDNGGPHWATKYLRGNKGDSYEGGIRIPFLVTWPAEIPQGQRLDAPICHIDIAPTLISAAGGTPPRKMDGRNLLDLLKGTEVASENDILYWDNAIRKDQHDGGRVIHRWKVVLDKSGSQPQLYDLLSDPSESVDVAAKYPAIVSNLLKGRIQWLEKVRR
ncbi:sulfatase [Bremerella sp.]|uniref:sulfatase family protein n=1 Tax=Bremerella sp. TaxID=2795602 RepID=UPI00391AF658